MQGSLPNPETTSEKPRVTVTAVAASTAALVAVIAIFWILFTPRATHHGGSAGGDLPMTAAEQEYVKNVQVGNLSLSRAENFIHQEVTILNGEVYNGGSEPVSDLRLTTTYLDEMNQIVLKETRPVLGTPEQPLAPGERRPFEISFDHVPNSWNRQQPFVKVTYLRLRRR